MGDQAVDHVALGPLVERGDKGRRHHRAHPVNRQQVVPFGAFTDLGGGNRGLKRGPCAVPIGQQRRRAFAHMPDAKGKNHARKADLAPLINRVEQVGRGFLAPALAVLQLLNAGPEPLAQGENIRRFAHPSIGVKLFDLFRSKALDVKGRAGHEVFQLFHRLRGADHTATAPAHRVALFADGVGPAFRANGGKFIFFRILRAFAQVNIGDFRDHIPGAIDLHPITHADVLAVADRLALAVQTGDVVLVVQGGVTDHHAADRDGMQARDRRQGPCAPDLNFDVFQPRPRQFGGEFMRNCPTRRG